jgi:hypothetical protein
MPRVNILNVKNLPLLNPTTIKALRTRKSHEGGASVSLLQSPFGFNQVHYLPGILTRKKML